MSLYTGQLFWPVLQAIIKNLPDYATRLTLHVAVDEVVRMEVEAAVVGPDGEPTVAGTGSNAHAVRETHMYKLVPEGAAFDAEYECVGYQYKFPSTFGNYTWLMDTLRHNGREPVESRAIYVRKELPK